MMFRLPVGRVPFGAAYASLLAAGVLSVVYPTATVRDAVGVFVYLWGGLYIIGGGLSTAGIFARNYLIEWPGLIFTIGANLALIAALVRLIARSGGSFVGGITLCLVASLTALLTVRLVDVVGLLRRVDHIQPDHGEGGGGHAGR